MTDLVTNPLKYLDLVYQLILYVHIESLMDDVYG